MLTAFDPQSRIRSVRLLRQSKGASLGFSIRGGREHSIGIFVSEVQPASEAYRQGLRVGDEILRVNGLPVEDAVHHEVLGLLRSRPNVHLKLKRAGILPIKKSRDGELTWRMIENVQQEPDFPPSPAYSSLSTSTSGFTPSFPNRTNGKVSLSPTDSSSTSAASIIRRGAGSSSHNDSVDEESSSKSPDTSLETDIHVPLVGKSGIGCSICKGPPERPGIFVQSTKDGGVARQLGLKPGDQILKCNGMSLDDLDFAQAVHLLKASQKLDLRIKKGVAADLFAAHHQACTLHGEQSSGYNSSSSSVSGDATSSASSPPGKAGDPSDLNRSSPTKTGQHGNATMMAAAGKRLSMVAEERDSASICSDTSSSNSAMKIDRFKEWKDVEAEWKLAEQEAEAAMANLPSSGARGFTAITKGPGLLMTAPGASSKHPLEPRSSTQSTSNARFDRMEILGANAATRATLLDAEAYLLEERRRLDMEHMRLKLEAEKIAEEKRKLQEEKETLRKSYSSDSVVSSASTSTSSESSSLASAILSEIKRRSTLVKNNEMKMTACSERRDMMNAKDIAGPRVLKPAVDTTSKLQHHQLMEEFRQAHQRMFKDGKNILARVAAVEEMKHNRACSAGNTSPGSTDERDSPLYDLPPRSTTDSADSESDHCRSPLHIKIGGTRANDNSQTSTILRPTSAVSSQRVAVDQTQKKPPMTAVSTGISVAGMNAVVNKDDSNAPSSNSAVHEQQPEPSAASLPPPPPPLPPAGLFGSTLSQQAKTAVLKNVSVIQVNSCPSPAAQSSLVAPTSTSFHIYVGTPSSQDRVHFKDNENAEKPCPPFSTSVAAAIKSFQGSAAGSSGTVATKSSPPPPPPCRPQSQSVPSVQLPESPTKRLSMQATVGGINRSQMATVTPPPPPPPPPKPSAAAFKSALQQQQQLKEHSPTGTLDQIKDRDAVEVESLDSLTLVEPQHVTPRPPDTYFDDRASLASSSTASTSGSEKTRSYAVRDEQRSNRSTSVLVPVRVYGAPIKPPHTPITEEASKDFDISSQDYRYKLNKPERGDEVASNLRSRAISVDDLNGSLVSSNDSGRLGGMRQEAAQIMAKMPQSPSASSTASRGQAMYNAERSKAGLHKGPNTVSMFDLASQVAARANGSGRNFNVAACEPGRGKTSTITFAFFGKGKSGKGSDENSGGGHLKAAKSQEVLSMRPDTNKVTITINSSDGCDVGAGANAIAAGSAPHNQNDDSSNAEGQTAPGTPDQRALNRQAEGCDGKEGSYDVTQGMVAGQESAHGRAGHTNYPMSATVIEEPITEL